MTLVVHTAYRLLGGVATAIAQYVRSRSDLEHIVIAATTETDFGIAPVIEVGTGVGFVFRALSAVRRHGPDVLHLHSSRAGLLRSLPHGARSVVYSPHCFAFETTSSLGRLTYLVERLLAQRATIATVAEYETDLARGLGAEPILVPHVVDMRRVVPVGDRSCVALSGRISEQKAPSFLVAADLSSLGTQVVWIGDGPDRQLVESAGVRVTGWLAGHEARDWVSGAKLLVHVAAWEGAPFAVYEAIEVGTPALVRNVPSLAEWAEIQQKLGLKTSTPREFRSSVDRLLNDGTLSNELLEQQVKHVATRHAPERQRAALVRAYGED